MPDASGVQSQQLCEHGKPIDAQHLGEYAGDAGVIIFRRYSDSWNAQEETVRTLHVAEVVLAYRCWLTPKGSSILRPMLVFDFLL